MELYWRFSLHHAVHASQQYTIVYIGKVHINDIGIKGLIDGSYSML